MEVCSNYENCNTCLSQNSTIDASNTQVVRHFEGSGSSLPSNYDYERIYRPNGSLARTLYLKYIQDEKLQRMDKRQWYQCGELAEHARRTFQEQSVDEETAHFLQQASHKSDWVFTQLWHSLARSILSIFMSQTSINGLLGRGSMFVVSRRQLERLVGDAGPSLWGGVLLDLGAGDGRATSAIASLFSRVYVTEVSVPMRWILTRRGYHLVEADDWPYLELRPHVISALNLLDRCDRPLTLLRQLRDTLRPGGRALVALVLPYHHYVETGGQADHRPTEWLPIKGETFEEQAASAIIDLFEPAGFHVERWCRLPYLCEGDLNQAFYWLDDALFVLSVPNS